MKLVQDLRFVIGLFFAIVGSLLIGVGLTDTTVYSDGLKLNLWAGTVMAVFAAVMICLSIFLPLDDSHPKS